MRRLGACSPLVLAVVLTVAGMLAIAAAPVIAVEPAPSAPVVTTTVDPRSEGEGPADAPSPVIIAIGVVLLGVLTAAGTVLVVRVARR